MRATPGFLALAATVALASCGQEPSFFDDDAKKSRAPAAGGAVDGTGDDTAGDKEPADDDVSLPGMGGGDGAPDLGDGDAVPGQMPEIPGAEGDDLAALHKCLASWRDHPFGTSADNFKRINAAVTVGGFGNAVNDDETTAEPQLILIDAGVNVLGAPTYRLMNGNGWYCLKVNVNVMTQLTVDLHCNARLADQRVNVNVGSTQNDTTSRVGVHVLSTVDVRTVRPEGASCIR